MIARLNKISALALIALAVVVAISTLQSNWDYFIDACPAKDVLSWDANLRLTAVIDQYNDFQNARYFRAIRPLFDSPTWPALRSAIALLVFAISPTGPDTVLDVAIGFAFFCLLLFSSLHVALKITPSPVKGVAIWSVAFLLLLHTREIPAYSLSAMLETQGMFFTLWSLYFLWKQYAASNVAINGGTFPFRDRLLLCLSIQGLFHTKYPYGIMFLLALALYEFVRNLPACIAALQLSRQNHYRGIRLLFVALFGLFLLALILARPLIGVSLNTKAAKYAFYLIALILFIDFNVFVRRYRVQLSDFLPFTIRNFYLLGVLPAGIWIFLHPDRLSSVLGTQLHSQEQTRSFFSSYLLDVFDWSPVLIAVQLLAFCAIALWLYRGKSEVVGTPAHTETKWIRLQHFQKFLAHPSLAVLTIIIFQFLILEFLTGNKQLRHIYHLLPGLLLFTLLWFSKLPNLLIAGKVETGDSKFVTFANGAWTAGLVLLCVLMATRANGVFTETYHETRDICFTGKNAAVYAPARWYAQQVAPNKKYIVYNAFHDAGSAPPGRLLASEIDLLLRFAVSEQGSVRNDSSYRFKDWREFDELLSITEKCSDSLRDLRLAGRIQKTNSKAVLYRTTAHRSGKFCLRKYKLLHEKR